MPCFCLASTQFLLHNLTFNFLFHYIIHDNSIITVNVGTNMGNLCLERNIEHNKQEEESIQTELTPVEFTSIANTLETGDLCILYRSMTEQPHYAMFVVYDDLGDHSPLLLLKGKTRPLPLERFECEKCLRHVRIVSANTRIFYGDYVKVLICKLKKNQMIPGAKVDEVAEIVRKLNYHENELKIIEDANLSDACRSQYVCTFMLAHVMSRLGCTTVEPHTVTPKDFTKHLSLHEPISIKLPETSEGPLITGSPPFLAKLM